MNVANKASFALIKQPYLPKTVLGLKQGVMKFNQLASLSMLSHIYVSNIFLVMMQLDVVVVISGSVRIGVVVCTVKPLLSARLREVPG